MIAEAKSEAAHELLTATEAIAYLRLDARAGDPRERLRNLIRRQRLPAIKKGRGLLLFRKAALDTWLEGKSKK